MNRFSPSALRRSQAYGHFDLGLRASKTGMINFFKPPSLWYFIMAALENKCIRIRVPVASLLKTGAETKLNVAPPLCNKRVSVEMVLVKKRWSPGLGGWREGFFVCCGRNAFSEHRCICVIEPCLQRLPGLVSPSELGFFFLGCQLLNELYGSQLKDFPGVGSGRIFSTEERRFCSGPCSAGNAMSICLWPGLFHPVKVCAGSLCVPDAKH